MQHFFMILLSFVLLSVVLNDQSNRAARANLLDLFWKLAKKAAAQARELAEYLKRKTKAPLLTQLEVLTLDGGS